MKEVTITTRAWGPTEALNRRHNAEAIIEGPRKKIGFLEADRGLLMESSAPSVALFRLYTEKVARNAINRILGSGSRPYRRELNAATIDALNAMNIEVDVKSSRRLDKPLKASGGKGLDCVSPNTTVSPNHSPGSPF